MRERIMVGTDRVRSAIRQRVDDIDKALSPKKPIDLETFVDKVHGNRAKRVEVVPFTSGVGFDTGGGTFNMGGGYICTYDCYDTLYRAYGEDGKEILRTEETHLKTKHRAFGPQEKRAFIYSNILTALTRTKELQQELPDVQIEFAIPVRVETGSLLDLLFETKEGPKVDKARAEELKKALDSGFEPFQVKSIRKSAS